MITHNSPSPPKLQLHSTLQPTLKSKSIRIKSKSHTKFNKDITTKQYRQQIYKTFNLLSTLRQTKSKSTTTNMMKLVELEHSNNNNSQRQIIFLKELINRRKQPSSFNSKICSRSQSQNQSRTNTIQNQITQKEKQKDKDKDKIEVDIIQSEPCIQAELMRSNGSQNWKQRIEEYEHYDRVVKNLIFKATKKKHLSKQKLNLSPSRPIQSPERLTKEDKLSPPTSSIQTQIKSASTLPRRNSMVFKMNETSDVTYDRKMIQYLKFIFKINYSNGRIGDLGLGCPGKVYKVKIGPGNNSELIKNLIKRRFWMQIDVRVDIGNNGWQNKIDFVWTQNTIQKIHEHQKQNQSLKIDEKLNDSQKSFKRTKKLKKINQNFQNNSKILHPLDIPDCQNLLETKGYNVQTNITTKQLVSNHIPLNYFIGSKKVLFMVLHWYYKSVKNIDPFTFLPKTYHIQSGQIGNDTYMEFHKTESLDRSAVWIVKPGQNTNRGKGIQVVNFSQIGKIVGRKQIHRNGQDKSFIIQKYLKPFLYHGRKFDIRHFLLITSVNGNLKSYWFKQGYIRTSSERYDVGDLNNQFIHLTNDAIQKKSDSYGKYQAGNKVSYSSFQRYLDQSFPNRKYSFDSILSKMKQITTDLIHASFSFLDPLRKGSNFQLYGMDFMIDHKFQPFLIEVNANPCLEVSCPVLQRIIPTLLEHTFRIGLDPLFPPPDHYPVNYRYHLGDKILQKLKYQLIFDEKQDSMAIRDKMERCEKFVFDSKKDSQLNEEIFDDQNNKEC